KNHHPTVKSIALMSWLVKLVCRRGGTVADLFTGSGSTGVAAILNGCHFIGFEGNPDYCAIAEARCAWAAQRGAEPAEAAPEPRQPPASAAAAKPRRS